METRFIQTENANKEQWRLLSQYIYPTNVQRYFHDKGFAEPNVAKIEYITGCVSQAKAYYESASSSPLTISPLLLYYGSSLLCSGIAALILGEQLPIDEHGMRINIPSGSPDFPIAQLIVRPVNKSSGALQLFSNVYSDKCQLVNGESWNLLEILGSIPDLKNDFEQCYSDAKPFCFPVEIVKTKTGHFERVALSELSRYENKDEVFGMIEGYSESYLPPQLKSNYAILRPKIDGREILSSSIFGKKFLSLFHSKGKNNLTPDQLIIMFMGMHTLGYISRYHPEIWNAFVNNDQSGERLLIEKFLVVCERYCPNLILNKLSGEKLQFVYRIQEDITPSIFGEPVR